MYKNHRIQGIDGVSRDDCAQKEPSECGQRQPATRIELLDRATDRLTDATRGIEDAVRHLSESSGLGANVPSSPRLDRLEDNVRRLQEGQIFQAVNDTPRLATVERKIVALVEALALVTAWMEVHTDRVDSLEDAVEIIEQELDGQQEYQLDATVKIHLN